MGLNMEASRDRATSLSEPHRATLAHVPLPVFAGAPLVGLVLLGVRVGQTAPAVVLFVLLSLGAVDAIVQLVAWALAAWRVRPNSRTQARYRLVFCLAHVVVLISTLAPLIVLSLSASPRGAPAWFLVGGLAVCLTGILTRTIRVAWRAEGGVESLGVLTGWLEDQIVGSEHGGLAIRTFVGDATGPRLRPWLIIPVAAATGALWTVLSSIDALAYWPDGAIDPPFEASVEELSADGEEAIATELSDGTEAVPTTPHKYPSGGTTADEAGDSTSTDRLGTDVADCVESPSDVRHVLEQPGLPENLISEVIEVWRRVGHDVLGCRVGLVKSVPAGWFIELPGAQTGPAAVLVGEQSPAAVIYSDELLVVERSLERIKRVSGRISTGASTYQWIEFFGGECTVLARPVLSPSPVPPSAVAAAAVILAVDLEAVPYRVIPVDRGSDHDSWKLSFLSPATGAALDDVLVEFDASQEVAELDDGRRVTAGCPDDGQLRFLERNANILRDMDEADAAGQRRY